MEALLLAAGLLLTAALFGGMLFFSALVAPLVFTRLEAATAAAFIRALFPWYYLMIIIAGGLAAVVLLALRPAEAAVLAIVALAAVYARQGLMPRINRARDRSQAGDGAASPQFDRLHRCSVWLNAAQLLAAAVVLVRLGLEGAT